MGIELQTLSGRLIDLLAPDPAVIDIYDIATALARTPRFGGHTRDFYSVAQHCVHVSDVVEAADPRVSLAALLHDAAEAYVGDIPSPLKRQLQFEPLPGRPALTFEYIEDCVLAAVFKRFDLVSFGGVLPAPIHAADREMLSAEAWLLLPGGAPWAEREPDSYGWRMLQSAGCWATPKARARFLDHFNRLTRDIASLAQPLSGGDADG